MRTSKNQMLYTSGCTVSWYSPLLGRLTNDASLGVDERREQQLHNVPVEQVYIFIHNMSSIALGIFVFHRRF
jgi:hypothetical protein